MKTRLALASVALLLRCALALAQTTALPADFIVGDIRVEGLQRVSEGTVYNYLPVNIGDHLTPARVREAIKALYATGFFRDVQLRREGSTLVVVVLERPSIESFEITGNKDIKTEDLQKSLRGVGLATGKTFDRSVLEDVTQYLTDQYYARGKYGVKIDAKVEEESGNRVKIKIDIKEGTRAVIREINIVGNTEFKAKDILETLELKTPNWLSWYKQDDRYARESLQGDLEKIRNYYMDRGYANFQLSSTQVAIAPEKEDIFITVNIDPGAIYTVSQIKLAGTFVVPQAELESLLVIHPGDTFNRKLITGQPGADAEPHGPRWLRLRQGRAGTDGGQRQRIPSRSPSSSIRATACMCATSSFTGANRINDEVLRREMRQLEGGWLSNTSLERSKQRLQRLPYVKSVEFETTPVAGSPDLVDVNYKIEEGPASQLSGGIGYSETYKFMLNGSYADSDFLGTGERIAVNLNGGAFSKVYSIQHTNPYTNIDNLQRTISLTYSDVTQFVSSSSQFSSQTLSVGPTWAYPITEYQYLRFGFAFNSSQLLTNSLSSAIQAQQWVQQNGHPYSRIAHDDATNNIYVFYGSDFKTLEAVVGWDWDTRNRTLFADRGMRQSISSATTVPIDNVQLLHRQLPVHQVRAAAQGAGRSPSSRASTTAPPSAIPPPCHPSASSSAAARTTYAASARAASGPKDQFGNPYGGNLRITSQNELIIPDAGQVGTDRARELVLRPGRRVPDRLALSSSTGRTA